MQKELPLYSVLTSGAELTKAPDLNLTMRTLFVTGVTLCGKETSRGHTDTSSSSSLEKHVINLLRCKQLLR